MKNKLFIVLPILLAGCSNVNNVDSLSEKEEPSSVEEASSSEEIIDFGTVTFDDIEVFCDGYDGVLIRPYFSNPKIANQVHFTYSIDDESLCEIDEEGRVWYKNEGVALVSVSSDHFESTSFKVNCLTKMVANTSASDFIFPTVKQMTSNVEKKYAGEENLFVGDSFFQFWRDGTNGVKKFSTVFEGYSVFNIGVSGSTTHDLRAMINNTTSLTYPKNIIINIGVNNVDDDNESGMECFRNIKALVDDYLELFEDANIYYLSITRCSGYFAFKWVDHNASNIKMKQYCESVDRLHYLDINALYGDNFASYQQDGLHPNQAGYDLFEQIIKENVDLG